MSATSGNFVGCSLNNLFIHQFARFEFDCNTETYVALTQRLRITVSLASCFLLACLPILSQKTYIVEKFYSRDRKILQLLNRHLLSSG